MIDIVGAVVNWGPAKDWFSPLALTHYLQRQFQTVVTQERVNQELDLLFRTGRLERSSGDFRLCDPDCVEQDLYALLEPLLGSESFRHELGVLSNAFVFQRTASGGPSGAGPFTIPDFMLAAIQSWRFDPQRSLEVFSFEVKNRKGASASSVYQVVAHGRFVHYPYLVCPRAHVRTRDTEIITNTCSSEGIGLALFDVVIEEGGAVGVRDLSVVLPAKRRVPDPHILEQNLFRRLQSENIEKLEAYAKGLGGNG